MLLRLRQQQPHDLASASVHQPGGDHLALDAVAQLAHFLLALGATDFASIDARILLGNARGQVDLPLDAKGISAPRGRCGPRHGK